MVEIIEQVYLEIKNYGHEEQKKKLIAGIVITGGGAQLKHLKQLVEYITGMDTRIGYPNEHLAGNSDEETTSPMYATAVGLVLNSIEKSKKREEEKKEREALEAEQPQTPLVEEEEVSKEVEQEHDLVEDPHAPQQEEKKESNVGRKNIFEKWFDNFKDFLDNAE